MVMTGLTPKNLPREGVTFLLLNQVKKARLFCGFLLLTSCRRSWNTPSWNTQLSQQWRNSCYQGLLSKSPPILVIKFTFIEDCSHGLTSLFRNLLLSQTGPTLSAFEALSLGKCKRDCSCTVCCDLNTMS